MSSPRYVCSSMIRVAAVALAAVSILLMMRAGRGRPYVFYEAVVGVVLTFLALVHSSSALFKRWMSVAETLQSIVVTTVFGVCYLLCCTCICSNRVVFGSSFTTQDLPRRHGGYEPKTLIRCRSSGWATCIRWPILSFIAAMPLCSLKSVELHHDTAHPSSTPCSGVVDEPHREEVVAHLALLLVSSLVHLELASSRFGSSSRIRCSSFRVITRTPSTANSRCERFGRILFFGTRAWMVPGGSKPMRTGSKSAGFHLRKTSGRLKGAEPRRLSYAGLRGPARLHLFGGHRELPSRQGTRCRSNSTREYPASARRRSSYSSRTKVSSTSRTW